MLFFLFNDTKIQHFFYIIQKTSISFTEEKDEIYLSVLYTNKTFFLTTQHKTSKKK